MRKLLQLMLTAAAMVGAVAPVSGQPSGGTRTDTLPAIADTYVRQGPPNTNHGQEPLLSIASGSQQRVLVRFDERQMGTLVCGGDLLSARLRLHAVTNGGNWSSNGRPVSAHRVTTGWSELGATWNCPIDGNTTNQQADCGAPWNGGSFSAVPSATVVHTNTTLGWVEFDVTADARALLGGGANYGWILSKSATAQNGAVDYASREGNPALAPQLVLVYDRPSGPGADDTPPELRFTAPEVPIFRDVTSPEVKIAFSDLDSPVVLEAFRLHADGEDVTASCVLSEAGATCRLPAVPATGARERHLVAEISDCLGNTATAMFDLLLVFGDGDTSPPEVMISSPAAGALVNTPQLAVDGLILDDGVVRAVNVAGSDGTVTGRVFRGIAGLSEGANEILVTAIDGTGKVGTASVAVTLDTLLPRVQVTSPGQASLRTLSPTVHVAGFAADEHGIARVEVNGAAVALTDGQFDVEVALVDGVNAIELAAVDRAGNRAARTFEVSFFSLPRISITDPEDGTYVNAASIDVAGVVDDAAAVVRVNGVEAIVSGSSFVARGVPLAAGPNRITALVTNDRGSVNTESITVLRDEASPWLSIYEPATGAVLYEPTVAVRGFVSETAEGAGGRTAPVVAVNGAPAVVDHESFLLSGVALTPGENTLVVEATDAAGNRSRAEVRVTYDPAPRRRVRVFSGDGQAAAIGQSLPAPLVAQVLDADGQPIAGRAVLFEVVGGDGSLDGGKRQVGISTDAQGLARVTFTLGMRAGAGMQTVRASIAGFAGPAIFTATARPGAPALIVVDSGDQQIGVVGQRLPLPLVAAVIDAGSNRLAGTEVHFAVVLGGGTFTDGSTELSAVTDENGIATAALLLGPEEGTVNNVVEVTFPGVVDGPFASFSASARVAGDPAATAVSGLVLDNSNLPVPGATIRIAHTELVTQTDADGLFRIANAPVGPVLLLVDGSTTSRPGVWPHLEFQLNLIPGLDNGMRMPIFLLPIDVEHGIQVSETEGGVVTIPDFPGFALEVAPGSATFPDGSRSGVVSVTIVHSDRVPMVPNFGQQPRVIVTIQPAGTHFNPPARMTIPNLDGLAPGAVTEMYSFDHDLGRFVGIGPATVSEDGMVLVSNFGSGVVKGGWHCGGNPSGSGTAHNCARCQRCVNNRCVEIPFEILPDTNPGDCNEPICFRGSTALSGKLSDTPPDTPGDCRKEICRFAGGAPPGVPVPAIPDRIGDSTDTAPGKGCCGFTSPDPYDLATECCTRATRRIVPKNPMPITWPLECPDRTSAGRPIPPANGCGSPSIPFPVPQDPNFPCTGASFVPACNRHDDCWGECGENFAACNTEFLQRMSAICAAATCPAPVTLPDGTVFDARQSCFNHALAYYSAVSSVGYFAWLSAQSDACNCC